MTRDEAISIELKKILAINENDSWANMARENVDALISLGVLKVEPPKTAVRLGHDVMAQHIGSVEAGIVIHALEAAGLAIEKAFPDGDE